MPIARQAKTDSDSSRTVGDDVENDTSTAAHDNVQENAKHSPKKRNFSKSDDCIRLSVRLPKVVADCIEEMKSVTPASNATEFVKDALVFYTGMLRERMDGNELYVISKDGERTKYPLFVSRDI